MTEPYRPHSQISKNFFRFKMMGSERRVLPNHPSGDPSPSRDDIDMTREAQEAAKALSIVLHDYIIVGNGAWLSFRRERLL